MTHTEQNQQEPIDGFKVVPAGGSHLTGVAYPAGPDGPVVAGGPGGPCETSSLRFEEIQELLEHMVLIHADPAGQHAAVGTRSPSDCYPAGPAGPCVAGGPVGPDDYLQVLEPFKQLVIDHADPAGQNAVIQDTMDSLEHPRKLPDTIPDGGLVEKISDWEPAASPVPDATLDGRLMEGTTYLEHSALGVSLDSGLMEGMSSPEPVEQSVLNTLWVARPSRGITEETSNWEPVAHPVPDATLDGQLMEGTTYLEHSVLGMSLDSGLMERMSSLEPVEQSVLNTLSATRPEEGITEEISDWKPVAHPVPKITLDGRLMEGATYLEHSVLGVSLDSGLMEGTWSLEPLKQSVLINTLSAARPEEGITEELSDREPVALPVLDITLDGRPMEETTYLEHSALGVSLDSGLMAGMSRLEPFEQSVLGTLLVARPVEVITEMDTPERPALASQVDYGHSDLELLARPILDANQAGNAELDADPSEHSAPMTNDRHVEHLPS